MMRIFQKKRAPVMHHMQYTKDALSSGSILPFQIEQLTEEQISGKISHYFLSIDIS